jgi:hypothetical protein
MSFANAAGAVPKAKSAAKNVAATTDNDFTSKALHGCFIIFIVLASVEKARVLFWETTYCVPRIFVAGRGLVGKDGEGRSSPTGYGVGASWE